MQSDTAVSASRRTALPVRGAHYRPVDVFKNICLLVLLIAIFMGLAFTAYVRDYYHADATAVATLQQPAPSVTITETPNRQIVFAPEHPVAGLIFYPGGKVQYEAYAPLMEALAEQKILCVLLHMPCNLAVLDINAADGIPAQYPDIERWYLAGHSLGGAMGAAYAAQHTDTLDGLILLAAYSTKDLTHSGLDVLCLYGTEDHVMSHESYDAYHSNLPANSREIVIPGGCHAYFGSYGAQTGDGVPTISANEQLRITAEAIRELIG